MILVNGDGAGGNQIQFSIPFQGFYLPGKALRIGHVILIHARKIPSAGQIDRFIESRRKPFVFAIPQNPYPMITNVRNVLKRVIGRTIIDDQQFPIGKRLPDNRKHGKPEIASRIKYRHGHGNQRHIAFLNLGH